MNRRDFLKLGSAALLPGKASALPTPARTGRPHILMVMADQLRADCVGAYGNPVIHTPNLDRLAREGVRFRHAYTSTPSCTPARSALMTGLGPWRHGMLGYSKMATKPYPVEKARALAAAGYYTAAIGKNHFYPITNPHGYHHLLSDEHNSYWFQTEKPGAEQSHEPRCDYESWFWSQRPDADPRATGLGWNDQPARPFVYPEELHPTHWTGDTAIRFIEQYDRPMPLFLKVSFIRPHSPYDPPLRHFKQYEDAPLPEPQVASWASKYEPRSSERPDIWHGKLPAAEIRRSRQGYYGSVSFVDEQIGRIIAALERRGMLDDTLIVFFSDHGDMLGDHNLWRKTYAYESSARIPLLLRPGRNLDYGPVGRTLDQVVELRDILPTFLDAAGAAIPPGLEGRSLLQLLRHGPEGWRPYLDLEHNIIFDASNHWNALTDGAWKYIYHAQHGEEQLFHLAEDPSELKDLAADPAHADTLALWRQRLIEHLSERGEAWVKNGRLIPRPKGQPHSPHFPGYAPEATIAGWI